MRPRAAVLQKRCRSPVRTASPVHTKHTPIAPCQPQRFSKLRVQVLRCCLENATSVARTFLMADCIVTEIPELEDPAAAGAPGGMDMGGY